MAHALITGGAGFIGSHLVDSLLADGWRVTVFDNFDPFYDRAIKEENVRPHLANAAYTLVRGDVRDAASIRQLEAGTFDVIVHLAARGGVRPSIEDPIGYQDVNVAGTQLVLELARRLACATVSSRPRAASTASTRGCRGGKTTRSSSPSARTPARR